jgi:hypothetical protein
MDIRTRTLANLARLPETYLALRNAPLYPVEVSTALEQLLEEVRAQHFGAAQASGRETGH